MRVLAGCCLLVAAATVAAKDAAPSAESSSLRKTQSGDVVGFIDSHDAFVWRGIPYAQPPVGDLRWRAPRPAQPWPGTRQALNAPSMCIQESSTAAAPAGSADPPVEGSEDCLYLNITAPRQIAAGKRLPVMFWIHGGGNVAGESATFDGGVLATTQQAVVVTFNYRLGALGWFRHASLREQGMTAEERSGNYGTLDLIQALRWVRDNIAAFGGDPQLVTVFGESAGGWNTFSLLGVPQATGLFHRAIVQSGGDMTSSPAEAENFRDDREPGLAKSSNEVLLQLLIDDGQAKDRAGAKARLIAMKAPDIAKYLRSKSYAELLRAYNEVSAAAKQFAYAVGLPQNIRDGAVFPAESLKAAFSRPDFHPVPVILGTTRDEYTIYIASPAYVTQTPEGTKVKDKARYYLAAEYLSRLWRADSVDAPASVLSRRQPDAVFTYRFDWGDYAPMPALDNILIGATHGSDVPVIFGLTKLGPDYFQETLVKPETQAERRQLADAMMSYWTQFAITGDPGRGRKNDLPKWTAWAAAKTADNKNTMLLDAADKGGPRMWADKMERTQVLADLAADKRLGSASDRCAFLRSLRAMAAGSHFIDPRYNGLPESGNKGLVDESDLQHFLGGACTRVTAASR